MPVSPELFGYAGALLTTVSFLPQTLLTLKTRDTASLSLGMYSLFTAGVLFWLLYGIHKDDIAIIVANAVTLALASTILSMKAHNLVRARKRH